MNDCTHATFQSEVVVNRLTASADIGSPIIGYMADITIRCANCGTIFHFMGLPVGYSPTEPHVSANGTELRIPISPINSMRATPPEHATIRQFIGVEIERASRHPANPAIKNPYLPEADTE